MAAICPDFKWLGLQISDPIQNLDNLQTNLFSTIQSPDFKSPLCCEAFLKTGFVKNILPVPKFAATIPTQFYSENFRRFS